MKKLWGGRFKSELHETAKKFTYSLAVDYELLSADVKVSMAHALMLGKVGIISERDIVRGCHQSLKKLETLPVSELMTRKVIIASLEDDINDIMAIMTEKRIRHIPVMTEGELQGIISIGDVVKSLLQDSEHRIRYLKEYMYGSSL